MRVAPYINGRIFDKGIDLWNRADASKYAAKRKSTPSFGNPTEAELELYSESYGSHTEFAVMCPHTTFWQETIANVTGRIVRDG